MQTFLPYADFFRSAQCLDNKRLGKQRVECKQLIYAIEQGPHVNFRMVKVDGGEKRQTLYGNFDPSKPHIKTPWHNHPACVMWHNNIGALKLYTNIVITEWKSRGFNNSMNLYLVPKDCQLPHWFGDEKFHSSHRSNLLRKDIDFYSQYTWSDNPSAPYVWPNTKPETTL